MSKLSNDPSTKDNPFAGLGAMLVPVIVDRMMDEYVTPEFVVSQSKTDQRAGQQTASLPIQNDDYKQFSTHYVSLDRFDLSASTSKGLFKLIMKRHRFFSWKVERVELPPSLLADIPAAATNQDKLGEGK